MSFTEHESDYQHIIGYIFNLISFKNNPLTLQGGTERALFPFLPIGHPGDTVRPHHPRGGHRRLPVRLPQPELLPVLHVQRGRLHVLALHRLRLQQLPHRIRRHAAALRGVFAIERAELQRLCMGKSPGQG